MNETHPTRSLLERILSIFLSVSLPFHPPLDPPLYFVYFLFHARFGFLGRGSNDRFQKRNFLLLFPFLALLTLASSLLSLSLSIRRTSIIL